MVTEMPIEWKRHDRFKPAIILERINNSRSTDTEGRVAYSGSDIHGQMAALASMLALPRAALGMEVQGLVGSALRDVAHPATPDAFLAAANANLSKLLATRELTCSVLTTLSLDATKLPSDLTVLDCEIQLNGAWTAEQVAARYERLKREDVEPPISEPPGYARVSVTTKAKSDSAAFSKAMRGLDLLRALLCMMGNPYMSFSFGGMASRPLNVVRMGPVTTVHSPSGALMSDRFWYDASYVEARIHRPKGVDVLIENVQFTLNKLAAGSDFDAIVDPLLRYVRALDEPDPNNAFVRLWSALEALIAPGRQPNEKIVKRASFLFVDDDYDRQVLEHLRERRNLNVHASEGHEEATLHCYQLQYYFVKAAWVFIKHMGSGCSVDDVRAMLDLPSDPVQLARHLELARAGARFRGLPETAR